MLAQLVKGLKEKELYLECSLNELDKSCCSSKLKVLDFDAIKEQYSQLIGGMKTPKSCDALLIDEKHERLIFIEMKDVELIIKKFCEEQHLELTGTLHGSVLTQLQEDLNTIFLEEFRADKKVIDSWMLLVEIAHYCAADLPLAPYLIHGCTVEIYFALGLTRRHYLRIEAVLFKQKKRHQYHRIDVINFVPASNIEQFIL